MTYDYGKIYNVYLKSFEEIKKIANEINTNYNKPYKEYKIYHSTGEGGGLPITKRFVDKYFGTKKFLDIKYERLEFLDIKYERLVNERQLLKALDTQLIIYDEWVSHVYLKNCPIYLENHHLDDKLFEI